MKNNTSDTHLNTARERIQAFLFIVPLLIFIVGLVAVPICGTLINSFFKDITFLEKKFIFLANYTHLLADIGFWQSIGFTLLFTAVSVSLELILGLFCALLLNETLPFRGLLRTAVLIPWAMPTAISARIWELIYNYNYGLAYYLCERIGITTEPINWLGTSAGAFMSLVVADVWKTTPFIAIIVLAGLSAIPDDLYRQAKVDGAHFLQRFSKITLPLLKRIFMVALLFRTIDALRVFDLIFVLTHGGPGGATTSVSLYGYKYFLSGDFGYGSTVSIVLFLIAFLLSIVYIRCAQFNRGLS